MQSRYAFPLIFLIIVLASFRIFSIIYSNHYHADHAVHVLMSYNLDLPEDAYFWGQDRLGSFLPIVTYPFVKLGADPFISTSIINYIILILGAILFLQNFQSLFSKSIFTIAWFFPHLVFAEFLFPSHPDSVQLLIVALLISLIIRINKTSNEKELLIYNSISITLISLACWITESSVILFPVYFISVFRSIKKDRRIFIRVLLFSFFLLGIFGSLILYLKSISPAITGYAALNNPSEVITLIQRIISEVMINIIGKKDWLYAFSSFTIIALLIVFIVHIWRYKSDLTFRLLFATGVLLLILSLSSQWVLNNSNSGRYFINTFYLLLAAILYSCEHARSRILLPLKWILAIMVLSSTLTSIQFELFKESPHANHKALKEFKGRGQIALIGDYWHSYNIASIDPQHISATPNDKEYIRSAELRDKVLQSENIYIVRDYWMENFPDTLIQFDHLLVRNHNAETIAGYQVALYRNTGVAK